MKAIVVAPLLLVAAIAVILVPSASAMSKCQKCYLTNPATLCERFVCGRRLFTLNRAQLIGDFENDEDAQLIGDFEDDEDVGFGGFRPGGRRTSGFKGYYQLPCCKWFKVAPKMCRTDSTCR